MSNILRDPRYTPQQQKSGSINCFRKKTWRKIKQKTYFTCPHTGNKRKLIRITRDYPDLYYEQIISKDEKKNSIYSK